jgi:LemA protein
MSIALYRFRQLIAVVLLGLSVSACGYNTIPTLEEEAKAKWADVQNNYQRRADLIPNLVETVKGFTKEESTVYGDIANARAGMLNAQGPAAKIEANGRLDSALGRLLMLTENYPQLRSNEQYMRLQDELSGTENRISVARKRYNDSLKDYNTFVLQFPNNIWAGMSGFQVNNAYFQASQGARTVPTVKF